MLVARAIQGIGMSMFPIAFSLIRDQFPREKISIGQGIITSMFASGAVIGLSIGGTIIQHFGWQSHILHNNTHIYFTPDSDLAIYSCDTE
ncbi:MAG: MFS transporter [Candidatus Nitrosopolaris sp.]